MIQLTSAWCVLDVAGEMTCTPLVKFFWAIALGVFGLWAILRAIDVAMRDQAPLLDWVLSKFQWGKGSD